MSSHGAQRHFRSGWTLPRADGGSRPTTRPALNMDSRSYNFQLYQAWTEEMTAKGVCGVSSIATQRTTTPWTGPKVCLHPCTTKTNNLCLSDSYISGTNGAAEARYRASSARASAAACMGRVDAIVESAPQPRQVAAVELSSCSLVCYRKQPVLSADGSWLIVHSLSAKARHDTLPFPLSAAPIYPTEARTRRATTYRLPRQKVRFRPHGRWADNVLLGDDPDSDGAAGRWSA